MTAGRVALRALVWLLVLSAVALGVGWLIVAPSLSYVQIHGRLSGPERQVVAQTISDSVRGSLILTPAQVAEAVADLGWTTDVRVWRKSRERIVVIVERKQLFAAVDDRSYLTPQGELISLPDTPQVSLPKVQVQGVQVHRALDVLEMVQDAGSALELELRAVEEVAGIGWQAEFEPGFEVVLGGTDLAGRLKRFSQVFGIALAKEKHLLLKVDTRYDLGVAVEWKKEELPNLLAARGRD